MPCDVVHHRRHGPSRVSVDVVTKISEWKLSPTGLSLVEATDVVSCVCRTEIVRCLTYVWATGRGHAPGPILQCCSTHDTVSQDVPWTMHHSSSATIIGTLPTIWCMDVEFQALPTPITHRRDSWHAHNDMRPRSWQA